MADQKLMKKQLQALDGSIAKWANIVIRAQNQLPVEERGREDCACCKKFIKDTWSSCGDCPITLKTGQSSCRGTPYEDWMVAADGAACAVPSDNTKLEPTKHHPIPKKVIKAAERELDFLIKVRAELVAGRL